MQIIQSPTTGKWHVMALKAGRLVDVSGWGFGTERDAAMWASCNPYVA